MTQVDDKPAFTTGVQKITGMHQLVPADWFKDPEHSSFWLRIYPSLYTPHPIFLGRLHALGLPQVGLRTLDGSRAVLFQFGFLSDFAVFSTICDVYSKPDGSAQATIKATDRRLATSAYVFLAAPHRVDGATADEAATKRALDQLTGLICVHTGLNFMHRQVFDGEVSALDGKLTHVGPARKMPMYPVEGPFLAKENGEDIIEISGAISSLHQHKRGRVLLALQLMDEAMRKDYGFFEYWTALEVVCDGKGGKIKSRLAEMYEIASHNEAAQATGFQTLSSWRGLYVHKGIRPHLSADIERYIQILFLDLLRYELNLPLRRHLASLLVAPGYDLTPIGLMDRRTAEQRSKQA